jgi:hypothetical protein
MTSVPTLSFLVTKEGEKNKLPEKNKQAKGIMPLKIAAVFKPKLMICL